MFAHLRDSCAWARQQELDPAQASLPACPPSGGTFEASGHARIARRWSRHFRDRSRLPTRYADHHWECQAGRRIAAGCRRS